MAALARFKDIMAANINALLDRVEDPAKMVDQYLVNMAKDLAEVKRETAAVMAEEARCKRLLDENAAEAAKFMGLAERALMAQNEDDARVFLNKKQELDAAGAGLNTAYEIARGNAEKMRQMHDKLVKDINELTARKNMIKAKASVAKTQDRVNKFSMPNAGRSGAAAFDRMEAKVNHKLDAANAMAELNRAPIDEAKALEEKYKSGAANAGVDSELAALKAKLGMQ